MRNYLGQAVYLISFRKKGSFPCGCEFDIHRQICLVRSEIPASQLRKNSRRLIFMWSLFHQTHLLKQTYGFV